MIPTPSAGTGDDNLIGNKWKIRSLTWLFNISTYICDTTKSYNSDNNTILSTAPVNIR